MMLVQWIKFVEADGHKGREWPKGVAITMTIAAAMLLVISLFSTIGTLSAQGAVGDENFSVLTKLCKGNSTNLKYFAKANFDLNSYNKDKSSKVGRNNIIRLDHYSVMSDRGYTDGQDN